MCVTYFQILSGVEIESVIGGRAVERRLHMRKNRGDYVALATLILLSLVMLNAASVREQTLDNWLRGVVRFSTTGASVGAGRRVEI